MVVVVVVVLIKLLSPSVGTFEKETFQTASIQYTVGNLVFAEQETDFVVLVLL